jgi:hypothetical protein
MNNYWPNQRRELYSLDEVAAEFGVDLTQVHHCVLPPIYAFSVESATVTTAIQRGLGDAWRCPYCDAYWQVGWSDASQIHGGRAPMSWQRAE